MPVTRTHLLKNASFPPSSYSGFTLIEMIAGLVLFAVALVALINVFVPQAQKGIDPIWQVRATTLGQSLLSEISAKAFDENSQGAGNSERCNEVEPCSQSGSLGADGESRENFDDVDDFNGVFLTASQIVGLSGQSYQFNGRDVFTGFTARVIVYYDDNQDGINDDDLNGDGNLDSGTYIGNRKLIRVQVFTPGDELVEFSTYRENY